MAYVGSILKFILAFSAPCFAIYLGLKLENEKDLTDRVILIVGVGLSTFSPVGLFLYLKYWEPKREFSSACGKQAIIGLLCFVGRALITHIFPPVIEPWAP